MPQHPSGIHHVAIMAADIKTHIAFFAEVMGCPLVALFDMHGVPGGSHAFHRLNEHSYFSIVHLPGVADIPMTLGVTHAGRGEMPSAAGTMQHIAFRADSEEALLTMRDRIRSYGVPVIGPIDHGFCQSIYFAGPDHLALEISCSTAAIDPARWIDPKVLERAGIGAAEAAIYAAPPAYAGAGGVPQPAFDPAKPHMPYPDAMYQAMLAMPDAMVGKMASFSEPPVPA
jgi:catechol 2,3-dioxygenase-like lactoylglutathione lyase family enzyme